MEEVKKRGRPAKVPAAPTSNNKPVAAPEVGDVTTIPKKRGRPAKHSTQTAVKKPSTGRGRGRPPKNVTAAAKKKHMPLSGSDYDNDGPDSDYDIETGDLIAEDKDATNGNVAVVKTTGQRGRPPKGGKVNEALQSKAATGKGRGRPKVNKPRPQAETITDDEQNSDSSLREERSQDEDADDSKSTSAVRQEKPKKANVKKAAKSEDDESLDDDDDGDRPAAMSSAPGRGRPKKNVSVSSTGSPNVGNKRNALDENGESVSAIAAVPKKRGRPSLGKPTTTKSPAAGGGATATSSGKPRGRPKKFPDSGNQLASKNYQSEDGNQSDEYADNGSDKDVSANEDRGQDLTALVGEAT